MTSLAIADHALVVAWNEFVQMHAWALFLAKLFGVYAVYLIPIAWIIWWFLAGREQKTQLVSSIFAGIVAWQVVNRLLKMVYFHPRPLFNLPVHELLFSRPENSFPSDHSAFLMAIAVYFLLSKQPKIGLLLLIVALAAGFSRAALALHYPSDIIVGFLSGLVTAWVVYKLHPWLTAKIWNPLIAFAAQLKLA